MSAWAKIWTDGSTSQAGQPSGPGGWAFVAVEAGHSTTEISGSHPDTTNQRMELKAVREAIEWADRNDIEALEIYTDSAYIVNCLDEQWYLKWKRTGWLNSAKKPVANQNAWRALLRARHQMELQGCEVRVYKVKGHVGDAMNDKADQLAVIARRELQAKMEAKSE